MYPPFPHHDAVPSTIDASATDLESSASQMMDLGRDLSAGTRKAGTQVTGDLTLPVGEVNGPVLMDIGDLVSAARWAAGVQGFWSAKVQEYNTTVDRLNKEWREAVADSFGVQAPDTTFADEGRKQELAEGHASDVAAAKRALAQRLERERRTAFEQLEDDGDKAAGMLDRGPNAADAATMAASTPVGAAFTEILSSSLQPADFFTGLAFSAKEEMFTQFAKKWMKTIPGSYDPGKWVQSYTRIVNGKPQKVSGYYRGGKFTPSKVVPDLVKRAQYAKYAKFAKVGGVAVSGVFGFVEEWNESDGRPTDERIGRSVAKGASIAAGAAAGAAIGSVVPGVGTVIGGIIGGAIGSGAADWVGDKLGVAEWGGKAGDWVGDRVEEAGDVIGNVADKAGDALDKITPW